MSYPSYLDNADLTTNCPNPTDVILQGSCDLENQFTMWQQYLAVGQTTNHTDRRKYLLQYAKLFLTHTYCTKRMKNS